MYLRQLPTILPAMGQGVGFEGRPDGFPEIAFGSLPITGSFDHTQDEI